MTRALTVVLTVLCLALSAVGLASSAGAAGAAARSAQEREAESGGVQAPPARATTYPGDGVSVWRLGHDLPKLTGTPKAFKRFVGRHLDKLWGWTDDAPECAHSPGITVKRYQHGYAKVTGEGVGAHAGDPDSCIRPGNMAIYARWNGHWREVLGTQEGYHCADLRHFEVPFAIGGPTCLNRNDQWVRYRP